MNKNTPKNTVRTERLYSLGLLVASMVWGFGFVFSKIPLDAGLSPSALMFTRFSLAALVVGLVFRRDIRLRYLPGQWKSGLALGTLLFLGFFLQTIGLNYTTPAKNAFITGAYVVFVPLLWWIIKKKRPGKLVFLACLLNLVGVGVLSLEPAAGFVPSLGDALTLVAAIFFAAQIVATSLMAQAIHHIVLVFMQLAVAAGWSMVVFLFTSRDLAPLASWQVSGSVVYLALFSTCLCYFLQTMAQRWVSSAKAGILLGTESLFGSAASMALGYDPFSPRILVGGLLVFSSILLPELKAISQRRRLKKAAEAENSGEGPAPPGEAIEK